VEREAAAVAAMPTHRGDEGRKLRHPACHDRRARAVDGDSAGVAAEQAFTRRARNAG